MPRHWRSIRGARRRWSPAPRLLIQLGDGAAAQKLLVRCVGINPDRAEAWDALGLALMLHCGSGDRRNRVRRSPAPRPHGEQLRVASRRGGARRRRSWKPNWHGWSWPSRPIRSIRSCASRSGWPWNGSGRRSEAIDALETACALAPDAGVPTRTLAGRLLAACQSAARGRSNALRRACAQDPGNPGLRNDHAAVLMRLQRHAAARGLLESILQDTSPDPSVLCNLATALVSLGRQTDGENAARRAIALDPAPPSPDAPWRIRCHTAAASARPRC